MRAIELTIWLAVALVAVCIVLMPGVPVQDEKKDEDYATFI